MATKEVKKPAGQNGSWEKRGWLCEPVDHITCAFESTLWRKAKQMQPMWLCLHMLHMIVIGMGLNKMFDLGVGWHFFMWRCKWLLSEKSLSQYLHCFRGAPVWISMCSFRYCFLAGITFVQLQIFFMAFVNMCMHIVRSAEGLCTYLTSGHTVTVCMNLTMPCKVSLFEHLSTFVTFQFHMQLIAVLV